MPLILDNPFKLGNLPGRWVHAKSAACMAAGYTIDCRVHDLPPGACHAGR